METSATRRGNKTADTKNSLKNRFIKLSLSSRTKMLYLHKHLSVVRNVKLPYLRVSMVFGGPVLAQKIFPGARTISGIVTLSLKRKFSYDEHLSFDRAE